MHSSVRPIHSPLGNLIFLSRWLQAPLYVGLIIAQVVYVYRFLVELWHLIAFAVLDHAAPASVPASVVDTETIVMLTVLGLIDVVMISNLADPGQHQGDERVVHHRLLLHRQQLVA